MKINIKQIKNVVACGLMFSSLSSCLTQDFEEKTGDLGFTNESPFIPAAPSEETPGRQPSSDKSKSGVAPVVVASGEAPVKSGSGETPVLASGQVLVKQLSKEAVFEVKKEMSKEVY